MAASQHRRYRVIWALLPVLLCFSLGAFGAVEGRHAPLPPKFRWAAARYCAAPRPLPGAGGNGPVSAAGTITAAQQTVALPISGSGTVTCQVTGTWVATLAFEGTVDNTNWVTLRASAVATDTLVTSTASNGLFILGPGLTSIRVRASAYTSGTATVTLLGTPGAGVTYPLSTAGSVGASSAVTVADAADVALGATGDVAVQGDNSGTVSAKLRGLNKSIAAGLPVTQGTSPWVTSGTVTANQGGAPWSVSASGTFGVTQSTSPWVVSQNATFNTAIPDGTATGSLAGTDQAVTLSTAGFATGTFQIATGATWNGTVNFEASNDNATWIAVDAVNLNTGLRGPTYTTTNTNALFRVVASGLAKVRVRSNPYVAGTATITAEAGMGSAQYGQFVQGSQFAGSTVAQSPVIVGMNGASGIRYLTEANAVFPTTGNAVLGVGPGAWDGTNWQKVSGDTGGRLWARPSDSTGAALFPNGAALADATANPTLTQAGIFPYTFNGTTWDRQRSTSSVTGTTGTGLLAHGPLLWDLVGTTNFVKQAGDGSGRTMVVGAAATGAAVTGNPVLMGASDGTNAQTLKMSDTSNNDLKVQVYAGATAWTMLSPSDGSGSAGTMWVGAFQSDFNGASWDRHRNNTEATLLASASRTTTQTSADIVTYNTGAIQVIYDNTVGSTYSDTLTINGKDPASGKYYLLLSSAAIATVTTNVYTVDPMIPAVANVTAQKRLPRTIQIVVTAGNANAHTYSIGYILQPA